MGDRGHKAVACKEGRGDEARRVGDVRGAGKTNRQERLTWVNGTKQEGAGEVACLGGTKKDTGEKGR